MVSTEFTKKQALFKNSNRNIQGSPPPFLSTSTSAASATKLPKHLKNLSIPTIPSRFLTPVLRFDLQERDADGMQQHDLMNRLNSNSGMHSGSIAAALAESQGSKPALEQGAVESVLVARVARLTNDGSTLGPGSYNVDESAKAMSSSPRGVLRWGASKSKRI